MANTGKKRTPIRCSFCGKEQSDVRKLVAGPEVYICDECIELCVDICNEDGLNLGPPKLTTELDFENLGIKPRFKTVKFVQRSNYCFHLCPFSEPFNTIYTDHVAKAAAVAGFTIERADEVFGTDPIIEDIWQGIVSASVIIADVTGRNPNVMYEIGMAHTVGKPVVIITQTLEDVPFDLRQYRCIVYEYNPRGCVQLEERLSGTLRFLSSKR